MKKFLKVMVIALSIIIVGVLIIGLWQKDNISAFLKSRNISSEDLEKEIDARREELKKNIEGYISKQIVDISAEDEKKLLKGEISLEEIYDKYNLTDIDTKSNIESNDENSINNSTTNNNDLNKSNANDSNTSEIDDLIGKSIAKMYALKASYVNKLGELERNVYSQYKSLPAEEQNFQGKQKIVMNNMSKAADLEKQCDSAVETILSELKKSLTDLNSDTEIIKLLENAYKEEKNLKKSYYLSLYNN